MANSYWVEQGKLFFEAIKGVEVPNATLDNVDCILVKNGDALNSIPSGGGCYWIWKNKPINHSLHVYFFRKGINLTDHKHNIYDFKVFYITGLTSLYIEHIEKQWRESGLSQLCSYSTGR